MCSQPSRLGVLCLVLLTVLAGPTSRGGGGHPPGYVYVFERLKIPADHEGVLEHLARAAAYFEGQPDKDLDTYLAKVQCLAEHWAVWCEPGEVVPFFRRLAACKNAKVREMAGPRLMVLGTDAEWRAGVARHRTDEQKRALLRWAAGHWKWMPGKRQKEADAIFRDIMANSRDASHVFKCFETAYFSSTFNITPEERVAFLDHRVKSVRNRAWGWWLSAAPGEAVRKKLPAALPHSRVAHGVLLWHCPGYPDLWEAMRRYLRTNRSESPWEMAELLGAAGDRLAITLCERQTSRRGFTASSYVRALGWLRDPAAVPVLKKMSDEEPFESARALALCGDRSGEARLREYLKTAWPPRSSYRANKPMRAATALAALGDADWRKRAVAYYHAERKLSARNFSAGVITLVALGHAPALRDLITKLEEQSPYACRTALLLRRYTGQRFGYHFTPEDQRKAAIQKWKAWFAANRLRLRWDAKQREYVIHLKPDGVSGAKDRVIAPTKGNAP